MINASVTAKILLGALFFLSMGCSRTINFRLVNGSTLEPLAGVNTTLHFEQVGIATKYLQRHVQAGQSPSDGTISARDIPFGSSWTTTITFDKTGFYQAGAYYTGTDTISIESRVPRTVASNGEIFSDEIVGRETIVVKIFPAAESDGDRFLHNCA